MLIRWLERSLLLSACIVVRGRPENICRVEDYSHIFCCIDADTMLLVEALSTKKPEDVLCNVRLHPPLMLLLSLGLRRDVPTKPKGGQRHDFAPPHS